MIINIKEHMSTVWIIWKQADNSMTVNSENLNVIHMKTLKPSSAVSYCQKEQCRYTF